MSPIPLGILAASGGVAGDFVLLQTTVVGSGGAADVTFSNLATLAAGYKHLQIRSVVRGTAAGTSNNGLYLQFNGDAGNNYAFHRLEGAASVVSIAVPNTSGILIGITLQNGATTGAFTASVADILDPFVTTKNKTVRALSGVLGGSVPAVALQSGFRNNTEALTSIKVYPDAGSFLENSRFSLYGVK